MKSISAFILGLLLSLPFSLAQDEGGELEAEAEDLQWNYTQMPFTYQNIQVPREFWDALKSVLRKEKVKESIIEDVSVLPISVQFELSSDDKLVLKNRINHRLMFVEGGGEVDLFDYVQGRGAFNMRFSPQLKHEGVYHLLYISDSPGKEVNGDEWGNGCGRIYNLSEKMDQFVDDVGVRVTTSRRHYLHLMAGTFIFFQLVDERLFLGYIRVKDSRYPNFSCKKS